MNYPNLARSNLFMVLVSGLLLCAHLSGPGSGTAADAPTTWTARKAVVFALENSPDSRIAAQRIASADALREQANSAFQPRLNLSAAYAQTDNPMYSFGNILNQGSFTNNIDFNNPGRTDNLNLKAEILYRFYNGGRDMSGREAAEAGYLASEHDRRTTEHRLGFEVISAFQNIVQALEQADARQAELEAIEASLQVARARYEAGDLLKAELLNFEVQQARASENLIISNHRLELAQKIFLNLLGLKEGTVLIDRDTDIDQEIPDSSEYQVRPEIADFSARLEAAEAELARAEGSRDPTLDGFASYQYDHGWVLDGSGDSWAAGLKLNYNLYDGRQVAAEVAEKRAEYEKFKEQLAKLQLGVNLEIQEAELNYRQAVERQSVTGKMVEVARESAQLSRERFKEGVVLSSDLIDTEVRLTDALVRQSIARANYRIAIANVRRASGHQQFRQTTAELLENQP